MKISIEKGDIFGSDNRCDFDVVSTYDSIKFTKTVASFFIEAEI